MKCLKVICIIVLISNGIDAKVIDGIGFSLGMNHGLGDFSNQLNSGFQTNIFAETGKIVFFPGELNFGLMYFEKKGDHEIHLLMVPVTFLFTYTMQGLLNSKGLATIVKAGTGVIPQRLTISDHDIIENIDPSIILAIGLSKPLTNKISVFIQASYLYIIQKYQPEAKYNGNFITLSVGLSI
jgi:hypothetical protein